MGFGVFQLRRDSAADWTSADPVLFEGEIGLETDTGKVKLGDGATAWTSLAYGGVVGPQGPAGPDGEPGPESVTTSLIDGGGFSTDHAGNLRINLGGFS